MSEKIFLGYIVWDLKKNAPASGTRRFKVWSSISEARSRIPFVEGRHLIKPVFVEVTEHEG